MTTISSVDLHHEARISYRQLTYWRMAGYITPVGDPGPGSGRYLHWSLCEAEVVKVMAELVRVGFEPHAAEGAARALIANGEYKVGPLVIRRADPC